MCLVIDDTVYKLKNEYLFFTCFCTKTVCKNNTNLVFLASLVLTPTLPSDTMALKSNGVYGCLPLLK